MFHYGKLRPYSKTSNQVESHTMDKHSRLSGAVVVYSYKKFYNIGPRHIIIIAKFVNYPKNQEVYLQHLIFIVTYEWGPIS